MRGEISKKLNKANTISFSPHLIDFQITTKFFCKYLFAMYTVFIKNYEGNKIQLLKTLPFSAYRVTPFTV